MIFHSFNLSNNSDVNYHVNIKQNLIRKEF